jgi:hypothetical protein
VVIQETRQEPGQLVAFGLAQWREQLILDGGEQFVEPFYLPAAAGGLGRGFALPGTRQPGQLTTAA